MRDWFNDQLGWMYWTPASATVFALLFGAIAGLAVLDRFAPGYARKGFLPMPTTRGDRFFVAVLTLIAAHVAWVGITGNPTAWPALVAGLLAAAIVMRWG